MDEDETELRNPFPSPPSHYQNYTAHNLKLLSLLREGAEPEGIDLSNVNQRAILSDQSDIPEWPLAQLEKPRVDWIIEEGHYTVFGDTWQIKESIPSLAELGGHQLYPSDPAVDRRPALLAILRSMLVTYSSLLGSLLEPPNTMSTASLQPEWQRYLEWITVLSQNLMGAANDLRPIQARVNLEMMMTRQLELRREETKRLHLKCDELEAKLAELKSSAAHTLSQGPEQMEEKAAVDNPTPVTTEDVAKWAEEIQ
ncbi:hypothetical protein BDM02DRAFT_13547 [Thelephora ganbajun]|uniref:Uncharacterized protein n=1 Tax=Thelephora ganbajun TaxID=370292 RepID=A0ACB6ZXE7_THEGA|nr:hypothetical protein BDM02DRAFT_13547 [Thelephora ganbajun]